MQPVAVNAPFLDSITTRIRSGADTVGTSRASSKPTRQVLVFAVRSKRVGRTAGIEGLRTNEQVW